MAEKKRSGFTLNAIQTFFSIILVVALITFSILSLTSSSKSLKLSNDSKASISQLEAALEV